MATAEDFTDPTPKMRRPPARTPEEREKQLIAMSYDLVERQIQEGTASSQILMHLLKAGSTRERLEQRMIERNVRLADAKVENIESQSRIESLYSEAMDAMRNYQGRSPVEQDEDV